MACCIFGAFLISQLLVAWRWLGAATRLLSIGAAVAGVGLLSIGIYELRTPAMTEILAPICSGDGKQTFIRVPLFRRSTNLLTTSGQ